MKSLLLTLGWLIPALALLIGCSKPEPPILKPEKVLVKAVTPKGLELEVTLDAHNPNSVALSARSVTARVTLADKVDLGKVTVDTKVKLPANKHSELVVPMSLEWGNTLQVGLLAASKETIPFKVEGTAEVGFESISFNVPFTTEGKLTRQELLVITSKSLPLPF
jgi:LEA14-like dessication related protein